MVLFWLGFFPKLNKISIFRSIHYLPNNYISYKIQKKNFLQLISIQI